MSQRTIRALPLLSAAGLALALATAPGCEAEVTPAGAPVGYAETTAGPGAPDDVIYEQDAPVVDIDAYPTDTYGGVTVYYVGGTWYRHDERGWGRYRQEPPELAHTREAHASDPRWIQARERPPAAQQVNRGSQAPAAGPHEDARPVQAEPQIAPRAEAAPQPKPKEEDQNAAPPAKRRTVKRPAPHPQPAQEPEHR
jgi:hypothetical protein